MTTDEIRARLEKLGLACEEVPLDRLDSAVLALACFPMYMVANVHAWTSETQWQIPIAGGIPGSEALREAFAIGKQERGLQLTREHGRVLGSLLSAAKPSDRVIYEYAVETLKLYLGKADEAVADHLRASVARSIRTVAESSGKGWFGSGEKISPAERDCMKRIADELGLLENTDAAETLGPVLSE
jgi:hypothetical protein